jgi:hypothetical protein
MGLTILVLAGAIVPPLIAVGVLAVLELNERPQRLATANGAASRRGRNCRGKKGRRP